MYRFKSKADSDLIMMAPVGDQILRILGREPAAKGIIGRPGAALRGRRVLVWREARVGPVQLGDFGRRAPRGILLPRLGQQLVAVMFQAVGQIEAGRAFGDQGPVPRAWALAGAE